MRCGKMIPEETYVHGRRLRAPEAADYLGLSPSTLAKMRLRGDGPRYAKAGPRIVVYDVADLDIWLTARKRSSTSEIPPAVKSESVAA
jgi:predicted DNA-binding transcriptional regulator AlpA